MAWTYDPTEATPKDFVRGLIADTDTTDQLLQDETITAELARTPNVYWAAYKLATRISRILSRRVTLKVGDTQEWESDAAKQYGLLLKELKVLATTQTGAPYAGGLSISEKQTHAADTDRVRPAFTRQTAEDRRLGTVPEQEDIW